MRSPSRYGPAACALALCAWLPVAHAQKPSARLDYRVADELSDCPRREEIADQISDLLRADPWRADAFALVEVALRPKDAGIVATIVLWQGNDTVSRRRELSLPVRDCRELGRLVALAVAIALDPKISSSNSSSSAISSPQPSAPVLEEQQAPLPLPLGKPGSSRAGARPPVIPPPPASAAVSLDRPGPVTWVAVSAEQKPSADAVSRSDLAVDWELSGRIGVAIGLTPSPTPIVALGPVLHLGHLSLRLEAIAGAPSTKRVAGGRVGAWLVGGGVLPCGRLGLVSLCAAGWAALFRAEGRDLLEARRASRLWAALGGRAALALLRVSAGELSLFADGFWSLRHYSLVDSQSGASFWEMPKLGGTMGVAVGARF